ncbi:tyrosine-type recombinase/integrase [Mycobacterium sp. SM1]|uniref:tyrosine-type recombinase/integrase n=1 Tax=Mycobacterium sp. SM1 TaxID=2816243 RepID=UPI0035A88579
MRASADRLLFALLLDTGVRIGEPLGLRHEDLDIAARTLTVRPRPNDNGARAKTGVCRTIPTSPELMRLLCRLSQRRVRRPGFGLRVRQPVVGAEGTPVGLPRGLGPGASPAGAHRHRFRAPPVPA